MEGLSTPSLGITRDLDFDDLLRVEVVFQLPLSGSLKHLTMHGGILSLSTPSLGITEPDSGIFRLSAAFCRGTSSHK